MPRFEQQYNPTAITDFPSSDSGFIGIDMTHDKAMLQPGMLSLGQNSRLRTGRVKQRGGTAIPGDFNPAGGYANSIVGSGVFRDPDGNESLVIALAGAKSTIVLGYGRDPITIEYSSGGAHDPTGDNGTVAVEFAQAFDKLVMLRRPVGSTEPLVWDGDPTHDWEKMYLSANGNTLIPGAWNAEPFMRRLIYYYALSPIATYRDTWILSDDLDYTSYDPSYQSIRTNPAESDYITRIMSYFHGAVIVFKSESIHMATQLPVFPVQFEQRIINRELGSVGNKMPLMVGNDLIFLSQPGGFYRLSEVITDSITTMPVPISEPIQTVIDNIDWFITGFYGCSAAVNNFAYFGVGQGPNYSNTKLNAILVYDTQRRQWESAPDLWTDPDFGFHQLHVTNYFGGHRVYAVDNATATVYLLYEGVEDNTATGTWPVPLKVITRGYVGDDAALFKKFGRATIGISTYNPRITVTAITDGFNERKVLTPTPITKDRTKFYQHGHKTFDIATDDIKEQKREDYSTASTDNFAAQDFEDLPEGPIFRLPGTLPLVAGDLQESTERLIVRSFGRWAALEIENDQGICEITNVSVESTHAVQTIRTAA